MATFKHMIAVVSLLLASASVHALPADPEDGIGLDAYALFSQVSQAGQRIGMDAAKLVDNALGLIGVPYRRAGQSAERGFDCSGFVRAVFEQTLGLLLPRNAAGQAAATARIDRSELQPGDLVFFHTLRKAFSHVGIYIGDDKFVHAPRPGTKIRVESLDASYWRQRFDGARRVIASASAPGTVPEAAGHPQSVQ